MTMSSCPVDEALPRLRAALAGGGVAVLTAPPGAGKTTRVPPALLDALPARGRIVMLEPRRLAAVSAARWMARALGEEVGRTVGYAIRFERRVSAATRIEVVTEGILTRRLQADPGLEGVALVIFDEFHERSLNADLALALCLDARRNLREDLALLVMSATMDAGPVAALLGGAPVVVAPGKTFAVDVRYLEGDRDSRPPRVPALVARAVERALAETEGDVLAFLPGAGEIRACADLLRGSAAVAAGAISLHPLYADLPFEEQERALLPGARRKVVLATSIAETSLTIEGVRTVVDSGLARRVEHHAASGMGRLVTVREARSQADQRAGRAGRTAPGVCYRLFSRQDYEALTAFAPPEVLVADLASLALELAIWGAREPAALPWLDPPPAARLAAARASARRSRRARCGAGADRRRQGHGAPAAAPAPGAPRAPRGVGRRRGVRVQPGGAALRPRRVRPGGAAAGAGRRRVRPRGPHRSPGALSRDRQGRRRHGRGRHCARRRGRRSSSRACCPRRRGIRRGVRRPAICSGGLLLDAYPDRLARARDAAGERYLLANGRGARLSPASCVRGNEYVVAVEVDAGTGGEGVIHVASAVDEATVREELAGHVATERSVAWDARERRVGGVVRERIGAVVLAERPFAPGDEEAIPVLCRGGARGGIGAAPVRGGGAPTPGARAAARAPVPGRRVAGPRGRAALRFAGDVAGALPGRSPRRAGSGAGRPGRRRCAI